MNSTETTDKQSISAFVVCCNEESNMRRCLESVTWCDEIVVIDSGSTDRTLEICKEYTNRIIEREWPGFVEQKRFGLEQCNSEWVLNLDADEEVSEELREEILKLLRTTGGSEGVNGYELNRVVFYMNKWWRSGGWHPEYRLRLFKREFASWGGTDPHEKAIVSGRVERLKGELHHFTYDSLRGHINSLNSLSSASAQTLFKQGKRASFVNIFFNPIFRFFKFFLFRKGYKEGFPGLIVAILEAFYVFLKYAKIWELERRERSS